MRRITTAAGLHITCTLHRCESTEKEEPFDKENRLYFSRHFLIYQNFSIFQKVFNIHFTDNPYWDLESGIIFFSFPIRDQEPKTISVFYFKFIGFCGAMIIIIIIIIIVFIRTRQQ